MGIEKHIDLVRIDLVGSEYQAEQECSVRTELAKEPYAAIVRGRHMIASGAGLSHDIAVFVSGAIASGALYDLMKYVVSRIGEAFFNSGIDAVPLNKIAFMTRECDFVVTSNCNAGVCSDSVDYNQLLSQMEVFAKAERENGRAVAKIEAPCDLRPTEHGLECSCCGVGNYSLWRIEYKSGERWPEALYDAVNKTFIKLPDDRPFAAPEDPHFMT